MAITEITKKLTPRDREALYRHLLNQRISTRTKEAMRKAKKEGKRFGRPTNLSPAQIERIIEMAKSNRYSVRMIADAVNAPVTTTQRVIRNAGDRIPPRKAGRRFGTKMTKRGTKRKIALPKAKPSPADEFI